MRTVHYAERDSFDALCGVIPKGKPTNNPKRVTCPKCKKELEDIMAPPVPRGRKLKTRKKQPVSVCLTLMIQKVIEAKSEEDYEKKRDSIISRLEDAGYNVSVESEENESEEEERYRAGASCCDSEDDRSGRCCCDES